MNFDTLKLKKLIATHYEIDKPSYKLEIIRDINGDGKVNQLDTVKTPLVQNGDFRSPECVEILKEADIVVTNPPFSLFREYIAQLVEYGKKFIIMSNNNAITYKEIFPLLKDNKMWLGYSANKTLEFEVPSTYKFVPGKFRNDNSGRYYIKVPAISWFTNLDISKRHQDLILYRKYDPVKYPKYDNYDAINVDKVTDIPEDYYGEMGVPITFLDKHNPEQFEIIGIDRVLIEKLTGKVSRFILNNNEMYARIIIKRKVN